jgi:hypothetical protein
LTAKPEMSSAGIPMLVRTILILSLLCSSCAVKLPETPRADLDALYIATDHDNELLTRNAPIFLIRDYQRNLNRIGTAAVRGDGANDDDIYINTEKPVFFTMVQEFQVAEHRYTNLIYRVHFPETPLPHLTSGDNIGLLIYITLDNDLEPVLITTLHTCGCYLAFVPTSRLPKEAWPAGWPENDQIVFGEQLPHLLEQPVGKERLLIDLRSETHRVRDIRYIDPTAYRETKRIEANLQPMSDLDKLPVGNGKSVSFFATDGIRKGYVRGSRKHLEMLLISWWALDLFVGEDKALGPPETTGVLFYTSLKFWDRAKSNIWFFANFLDYWGWRFDLTDR